MARHAENILLDKVTVDDNDRLPLDPAHVDRLTKSISEVGLLEPIIVCRRTKRTPTLILVAGRHRWEACKRLKHETILAIVENEDSPAIEHWRVLAEIDENLIRRNLTPAQQSALVAQRKAAYEAVHGPAKAVGGRASAATQGRAVAPANLADASFTADTAAKTGKSERAVQREATRAKILGPDLHRVVGTLLDKGVELDALAKMPDAYRSVIIDRVISGEAVSAVDLLAELKRAQATVASRARSKKALKQLLKAYRCADSDTQDKFLRAIKAHRIKGKAPNVKTTTAALS